MADLEFPADQVRRLQRLMDEGCQALTPTQQKQARMVASLVFGEAVTEIAARERVGKSTVSNVKNRLLQRGLEAYISKWEATAAKKICESREPRCLPGPRGITSIDEWLAGLKTDDEPVFEIAQMLVSPEANVVVLAVRDRSEPSTGAPKPDAYPQLVRRILDEPLVGEFHWSPLSVFDSNVTLVFRLLIEGCDSLAHDKVRFDRHNNFPNPIPGFSRQFGEGFEFLIFAQGEVAENVIARWSQSQELSQKVCVRSFNNAEELLQRLATIIYRLREEWSCAGLLPLHWMLRRAVEDWSIGGTGSLFAYECDEQGFGNALKHMAVLWRYPALGGGLFHLERSMWRRLPWEEEFGLAVPKIRLRVTVEPNADPVEGIKIFVRVFPEIELAFYKKSAFGDRIDPVTECQRLRRRIRATGGAVRLWYSTQPPSFTGWLSLFDHDMQNADLPQDYDRIRTVLIPRHIVTPNPIFPLKGIASLAAKIGEDGVFYTSFMHNGTAQPTIAMCAPGILEGICRAFVKNIYGDRLEELREFSERFASGLPGAEAGIPWQSMGVGLLNPERPSYWCFDSPTEFGGDPDGRRRQSLERLQARAAKQGRAFNHMPHPDATIKDTVSGLLRDCDADFLISGLEQQYRNLVGDLADAWRDCLLEFINKLYDVTTAQGKGRLLSAIPAEFRAQAAARMDEVRGWTVQILGRFAQRERRVIRRAIEVAQRCVMAGLHPTVMWIETKQDLLKRWRGYLSRSLPGRMMQGGAYNTSVPNGAHLSPFWSSAR